MEGPFVFISFDVMMREPNGRELPTVVNSGRATSITRLHVIALLFVLFAFSNCTALLLPKEQLPQFQLPASLEVQSEYVNITLSNPLHCPVRISIRSAESMLQPQLAALNPIVLPAGADTSFSVTGTFTALPDMQITVHMGNPSHEVLPATISQPFPADKTYRVVQGNNSQPTHHTDWSRYAIDIDLQKGDTVCAATDGVVVGVVDQYRYGGAGEAWKPYGNFITLYDTISGLFTQYVHLQHRGSLVQVGDAVQRGQPIGLSGTTGQTNIPHLHFNCMVPAATEDGLMSVPFVTVEGYNSMELHRGQVLQR